MRKSSRAVNSGLMLMGQFIGKGSLFVSMMLLARYLSDSDFGALLFSIVLGQMYLFFSDMGVSLVLNMRSSVNPADTSDLLSTSVTLRLILSLLGFPLLILAGYFMNMSSERMLVLGIIGISVFFESFAEMFYSIFRAREKMLYESISRIIMGLICLIAVIFLIRSGMGLVAIASAYIARTLVAAATATYFAGKMGFSLRPAFSSGKLRELFIASLPLGIMCVVSVIHQRADNVLIRQMIGENGVAAWQECLKVIEIMLLLVVPTLLPGALFPSLCRAFRDGGYRQQTGSMARIFTGFAVILSLAVLSTGSRFLRYVWGSGYLRDISSSDIQSCLYLCLGGLGLVYIMNILITGLLAINRVRIVIPVTTAALMVVIVGNLLLMPVIGLPSAGVFYLAGNLLIAVSYYVFLKWKGYSLPVWKEASITILAALPAFAIIPLIRSLPFIPALIIPVLIFIPVWWLTGGGTAIREVFPHRTD